jgi:glycosyltransferase involved in cell wall biosynthesis
MKLAFHYHTPAITKNGKVVLPAYLGLFLDSIAPHFDELLCIMHTPSSSQMEMMDYEIKLENVKLFCLAPHSSIPNRYLKSGSSVKVIKEVLSLADVVLIRASTPLLPFFKTNWKKPIALMLVSDATLGLENLPQPGWRKKLIKAWANWYAKKELQLARKSLTIVNSQLLFDELKAKVKDLNLIQTTTLSTNDFFIREDSCQDQRIRLIFAGRISRIKGILEIVEAMSNLRKEGFDLYFDLVGMVDKSSGILDEIQILSEKLGMKGLVNYLGYRTAGPQLLNEYRNSDVFVIASQASSEGFPRTLWEAMASSTPIVATAVSSIPAFTKGVAELAEPKNINDFTNKLRTVLKNVERRKEMIRDGRELAKHNTLEVRGKELSDLIKSRFKA